MIHHPIILGSKLVLLMVILVVLLVLHGILPPEQFRVAVFVAGGVFFAGVAALWIVAFKVFGNPQSRLGKKMILSREARADGDAMWSKDEFLNLVGRRGKTLSPLRPSGVAEVDGKRISVMTDGGFIEEGEEVEIVSAKGARFVVRAASPPESKT